MTQPPSPGSALSSRRPTLRDVAAVAGVDPSLVSRVVNGDAQITILPETRSRIEDAVERLGYRPNVRARGLRLARAFTVGFILPRLTSPVYAPIVDGVRQRAAEEGYVVMLGGVSPETTEATFARMLGEGRVDGLLLGSADTNDTAIREVLSASRPVVLVNRALKGVAASSATVDDAAGAQLAVEHLIGLGHKKIGVLAGPEPLDTTRRRLQGARRAIARRRLAGVAASPDLTAHGGAFAMTELLKAAPSVTAVFASNVEMAIGAMKAAKDLGRTIPDDLSIITLHDHSVAEFLDPALTTVTLPLHELGRVAFDLLVQRINGESPTSVVVEGQPELILRSSTAPPSK